MFCKRRMCLDLNWRLSRSRQNPTLGHTSAERQLRHQNKSKAKAATN